MHHASVAFIAFALLFAVGTACGDGASGAGSMGDGGSSKSDDAAAQLDAQPVDHRGTDAQAAVDGSSSPDASAFRDASVGDAGGDAGSQDAAVGGDAEVDAGVDAAVGGDAAAVGGDAEVDAEVDAAVDVDGDDDGIDDTLEVGPDPAHPIDTDGDKTPDYLDDDSDDDGVLDSVEGSADSDNDDIPNFRDDDSDGDCRSDALEAGASPPLDSDDDGHPDFLDRDSDGDFLADQQEDADCSGGPNGAETDALLADTDADGASDLIEGAVGTDPKVAGDNPAANGDLALLASDGAGSSELAFVPTLSRVDLYVILDRSGSMASEIQSVKNNLATVLNHLRCAPAGTGTPPSCLDDLWAGAGTVGYSGTSGAAFTNYVDVQANPNFSGLPTTEPSGCCAEPLTFATWAAITGNGSAEANGCTLPTVPARASCSTSPAVSAGAETFGYPCFRADAMTLVMLATDEEPLTQGDTYECPVWPTVVKPAYTARAAKLIGIVGSGGSANVTADLQQMASDTGAVDAANANAPLVFAGADSNAATAIQTGVTTFINGVPLDLSITITDDPSDAVDSVAAFVSGLTTRQTGTANCTSGLTESGTTYLGVRNRTPVCWSLGSKQNSTVAATGDTQLFAARVRVLANGITEVASRDVYFVVPPLVQ